MGNQPTIKQLMLQPSSIAGYGILAAGVINNIAANGLPQSSVGWFSLVVAIVSGFGAIFKNDGSHTA